MICPRPGLTCAVCARGCVIDVSETARAEFAELFAKLDIPEAPRCPKCRLKYLGTSCPGCNPPTSFHDHRVGARRPELYQTLREWREVNGERERGVPDRPLQPERQS